ncbi:uncharacterized protein PG986_007495 [Apiospora aurea]|uniref:Uncharacterized protein n=1 Tax=Apiospora aurea TaxID=335848 RepID=A0ABR1QD20_9PEZI
MAVPPPPSAHMFPPFPAPSPSSRGTYGVCPNLTELVFKEFSDIRIDDDGGRKRLAAAGEKNRNQTPWAMGAGVTIQTFVDTQLAPDFMDRVAQESPRLEPRLETPPGLGGEDGGGDGGDWSGLGEDGGRGGWAENARLSSPVAVYGDRSGKNYQWQWRGGKPAGLIGRTDGHRRCMRASPGCHSTWEVQSRMYSMCKHHWRSNLCAADKGEFDGSGP